MGQQKMKSSVVIARLLGSEGFSDHVANMVERYWMKNICRPGGRKKYRKFEKEITVMCSKLTDAEKMILGKFISVHKRMSFDTGLSIGLSAFARKTDKEYILADAILGESAVNEEMGGTVANGDSKSEGT